MRIDHVIHRIHVQRLLLAAALLGLSLSAFASKYPNGTRANGQSVWNQAMNGKSTTVNGQGSGAGSRPKNVTGNADVLDANGNVVVSGGATVSVNGKDLAVQATGKIDKGDVANAAVAAAGCAVGGGVVGAVVCGGVALAIPLAMNWMANAGVRVNPQTKELEKTDPAQMPADGFEYSYDGQVWFGTKQAACVAYVAHLNASSSTLTFTLSDADEGPGLRCRVNQFWKVTENGHTAGQPNGNDAIAYQKRSGGCSAGTYPTSDGLCSSSKPWLRASIADATGLMNNSRLPTADIVGELESAGQADAMPIKDVSVNGPASVQGPTTTNVTNNSTTNSTTTNTSTTNNYTYNNNIVTNVSTVTNSSSSVSVKNPDGTTTTTPGADSTETTTHGEEAETKPEDPPTQCDKFPNSLGCAELDTPSGEIPRETKTVTFEAEDVLGGGQCPADVMTTLSTLDGRSVKIIDWTTFCGMALPLRFLVMALASIMAFFIIMPGGVRE